MVIGITGGIGTGKSEVVAILAQMGYSVLSADAISHEIMTPGSPVVNRLRSVFGEEIIDADGTLNRKDLAEKAFARPENAAKLNEIVQSAIKEELLARIAGLQQEDPQQVIIAEIPLLYEAGWDDLCDKVWTVTADMDTRLRRIMARDGVKKRVARVRMKYQMDEDEKIAKADIVLHNDGTMDELREKVKKALDASK